MTTNTIALPKASEQGSRNRVAPLKDKFDAAALHNTLFWAGAVALPTGLIVIVFGWYGASRSAYTPDALSYMVSGGMLGLGLTFVGGFLYFGSWLAKIAADNRADNAATRESNKQLADTLLMLAELTSRLSVTAPAAATLVTVGDSSIAHDAGCRLIAHRTDLRDANGRNDTLTPCTVCRD